LTEEWKTEGLSRFKQRLMQNLIPRYWASCDQQNPHRVIRALEIIKAGGQKVSDWMGKSKPKQRVYIRHFVFDIPREQLVYADQQSCRDDD
jgi:tRNA dimethylallyltransferase